jgi:hypothetical protein
LRKKYLGLHNFSNIHRLRLTFSEIDERFRGYYEIDERFPENPEIDERFPETDINKWFDSKRALG